MCGRSQPYAHRIALIQYLQHCQAPSDLALRHFLHDMQFDYHIARHSGFLINGFNCDTAYTFSIRCSHVVPAKDKLSFVKVATHASCTEIMSLLTGLCSMA